MAFSEETEAKLIRRPDAPDHYMRVKPVDKLVLITLGDTVLAQSSAALRVIEVGKDIYDPVFYIRPSDLIAELRKEDKSTHCPLKGDATYYSSKFAEMDGWAEDIAWSYDDPLDFAEIIKGYVAFDASRVAITEAPHPQG